MTPVNIGISPNDGQGDALRDAFGKLDNTKADMKWGDTMDIGALTVIRIGL